MATDKGAETAWRKPPMCRSAAPDSGVRGHPDTGRRPPLGRRPPDGVGAPRLDDNLPAVNSRRGFVPFALLGILTLGTGLGVGLGLSVGDVHSECGG